MQGLGPIHIVYWQYTVFPYHTPVTVCRRSTVGALCFVMSPEADDFPFQTSDPSLWCQTCRGKLLSARFEVGGEE